MRIEKPSRSAHAESAITSAASSCWGTSGGGFTDDDLRLATTLMLRAWARSWPARHASRASSQKEIGPATRS